MERAGRLTVVTRMALLLVRYGSASAREATIRLMTAPTAVGMTRMVTTALVPVGSAPSAQRTWPAVFTQLPCELTAEMKLTLADRKFVRFTLVERSGPVLVRVRV